MAPAVFGLAERDENGEPDPERVPIWGMEIEDRAVLHWRENGRNQFAVCRSAESAASRFGGLFGLALLRP